jgi:hypothetical protein
MYSPCCCLIYKETPGRRLQRQKFKPVNACALPPVLGLNHICTMIHTYMYIAIPYPCVATLRRAGPNFFDFVKRLTPQIFRSRDGTPVSLGLLVPGVTPWNSTLAPETGANNPGLRLFQYDEDTGRIVDYHQFYLNLTKVIYSLVLYW